MHGRFGFRKIAPSGGRARPPSLLAFKGRRAPWRDLDHPAAAGSGLEKPSRARPLLPPAEVPGALRPGQKGATPAGDDLPAPYKYGFGLDPPGPMTSEKEEA